MGEVYKAKDTRLDRTVAIKVLPSHLAESPERRERFEREARAVSSLNHPNICTLHDIGEQDGTHYLVMEYIEGETLADRLTKGPLPLDQALRYGIQIADALDKAHRQGVVHRDLKPGNVMITKPGAKLLDFGLAKLKATGSSDEAADLSALPTEQKPLTKEGSILGTFQYMAPEQLEGKEADARTDIFAFGSVLYEMVTGKRAFEGKSQASLIGAILKDDPKPLSEIQSMSPPTLDHVVKKCLAKDPENRWQTARDLHGELKWVAESGLEAGVSGLAAARPRRRERLAWGLSILVAVLVTGITFWSVMRPGPRPPRPMTRFSVTLPASDQPHLSGDSGIALSADGRDLLYSANRDGVTQLYRRSMDQLDASPIRGTEGAEFPFFSPDGQWVGFFADGKLKKVSLAGGSPVTLCDVGTFVSASWGLDDVITFSFWGAPGLMHVPASGGVREPITTLEGEEIWYGWPDILPGGKAVLFGVESESLYNIYSIAVQSLETGELRNLLDGAGPRYTPTGHIVFWRESSLWAVPFDADRLEVTGSPTPVLEGIQVYRSGWAPFAVAGDGTLVYMTGGSQTEGLVPAWVDRQGNVSPLPIPVTNYWKPALSPDGGRLAMDRIDEDARDIWVYDLARGSFSRLTFWKGSDWWPIWSPDGLYITFGSQRSGKPQLYRKRADGSGDAEEITKEIVQSGWPGAWSPDGKTLVFTVSTVSNVQGDLWTLSLDENDKPDLPTTFLETPFTERDATFSPDGRWLAYMSDESERWEVYVRPFPKGEGKWHVST